MAHVRGQDIATLACIALLLTLTRPGFAQTPPNKGPAAAGKPSPASKTLADSLPAKVRTEYEAGKILFQDGDYATALLKFQDAYDKTKEPRLLWNVAVSLKNLRHYAKALVVLKQYLAEGGDLLTAQDRQDAKELSNAIEPFTTLVTLKVSEPGADVWLDDEAMGKSPITTRVAVDIGARKVRARKEGFRPFEKEVPVGGSRDAVIEVTLEKEGGHLELRVPSEATVLLDATEVGRGPVVQADVSIGGHALRITAPKMRPYQGDVTIEDSQTRVLEIKLEPDLEQVAELRVAVGCVEPDVKSPEQGLTVFLDNSNVSASPLGTRKRLRDGREVVDHVPFTVSPGEHLVQVRYPTCDSLQTTANATPLKPGAVEGMLPPQNPFMNGSPAGSPNGWRISAGVYTSWTNFDSFQNFFDTTAGKPLSGDEQLTLALAGPMITAGLQGRWFTFLLDARYLWGSTTGSTPGLITSGGQPVVGTFSNEASFSEWDVGLRVGPRFPFYFAALSLGVGAHLGLYTISLPDGSAGSIAGGGASGTFVEGAPEGWAALDVQPLCDWGIQAGGSGGYAGYASAGSSVSANLMTSFFVQIAYEPNRICERKRAGLYTLQGTQ